MANERIRNMSRGDAVFTLFTWIMGALILLMILYPLYYVIICSVSDPDAVLNGEVWFYPVGLTGEGYDYLLGDWRIWSGYKNTLIYALGGTLLSMLVTVPAGYALSRKDFKARRPLMLFFLFTMYFGGGLIPTYLVITDTLNMSNTIWAMIIPFCLNVYNMIIVRSYFESSLPADLWEAAQLDGCSNTRFLLSVALPLSKAVISVVMLYYLVGKWNEYFNAMMYLRDEEMYPLQMILRDILLLNESMANSMTGGEGFDASLRRATLVKYTSAIVGTLPMMILYPFLQKYFEKGVMIGAVKG